MLIEISVPYSVLIPFQMEACKLILLCCGENFLFHLFSFLKMSE